MHSHSVTPAGIDPRDHAHGQDGHVSHTRLMTQVYTIPPTRTAGSIMPTPDNQAPANNVCQHDWLSNPLDWPHIDRMILLAALILFSPILLSGGVILLWVLEPARLVPAVASPFLSMQLAYAV